MLGTPAAVARRLNAASRADIGSACATSTSDPSNARSLMTSMSSSAVPEAGTVTERTRGLRASFLARSRLRHLAVLLGEHARGSDTGDRGVELVLPAAHHVAVAAHHRVEPDARDVRRIVLLGLADLRVQHVRALEEIGFGRAGHQAGHGDAGVFQLGAD